MHPSADRVAWAWIVGGAGWTATALLGLGASLGSGRFYAAEVAWMAIHVAVFIGIVGLLRSSAVGDSVWARRGLGLAAVGRVVFFILEFVAILIASDLTAVFPVAVISTGIGLVIGGVGIARAGRWQGAGRFAPALAGMYPFVAIVPVFAATGSRPPDVLIAGWGVALAAVGVAMRMAELNVSQDRPLGADDHKTGTISVTPYENVRP